jgi:hypothetical protein
MRRSAASGSMPGTDLERCLAQVRATGHPDAAELSQQVTELAASGAPCGIDQVAELGEAEE